MENKITLPYPLAKAVWESLAKKGANVRRDAVGIVSCRFYSDELEMVTSLCLEDISSLNGIENLVNLKNLSIKTNTNAEGYQQNIIHSISDEDIKKIQRFSNLQYLIIENQKLIQQIDISRWSKLSVLKLVGNENLIKIFGLIENRSLGDVVIYGNKKMTSLPDLDKFIAENKNLYNTQFDVCLYSSALALNSDKGEVNENVLFKLEKELKHSRWTETTSDRTIDFSNQQMMELHNISIEEERESEE